MFLNCTIFLKKFDKKRENGCHDVIRCYYYKVLAIKSHFPLSMQLGLQVEVIISHSGNIYVISSSNLF
jgi:hypothetical protein